MGTNKPCTCDGQKRALEDIRWLSKTRWHKVSVWLIETR
jgi:hypothetical protein